MPYDIPLILGLFVCIYGILRVFSSFVEGRAPILGFLIMAVGVGGIVYAYNLSGDDIALADVPLALFRIIGGILN